MSATKDESFGFLPWIVIFACGIVLLLVYIIASNL